MKQMWDVQQKRHLEGFYFPWEGEPQICLLLLASQKKCEAFLGQLVKEINKNLYLWNWGKISFVFFSIFSQNLNSKSFIKKICCEVSCLEVVTCLVLSCAECVASAQDVAPIPYSVPRCAQKPWRALATGFIVYRPNLNQYLGATAT